MCCAVLAGVVALTVGGEGSLCVSCSAAAMQLSASQLQVAWQQVATTRLRQRAGEVMRDLRALSPGGGR